MSCAGGDVVADRAVGDRAVGDRAVGDRAVGDVAVAQWSVWSTTARLVMTDTTVLAAARAAVEAELARVERACSRFRPDSELATVYQAKGAPVIVSERLAALVAAAIDAAEQTDGDVDPTVGVAMRSLGYDRDIEELPPPGAGRGQALVVTPAPGWRMVRLDGTTLSVPSGIELDLGATAKAWTADYCANLVSRWYGTGVLVSLGGDIATAGPAPSGGWRVLVQDRPGDPAATVCLPAGAAMASSSTVSRSWGSGGRVLHHVLDPRSGLPAPPVWRTVTVAAQTCLTANTITTAALVRGARAPAWLRQLGAPARLVSRAGEVLTLGGWPRERADREGADLGSPPREGAHR
jgi:FAD:protein FMN transferase